MVKFYDPADIAEQAVVEGLLRKAGIEYFLRQEEDNDASRPAQILVAEEDLPHAEELISGMSRS